MDLIHIQIHCNIAVYKVSLKHRGLCQKTPRATLLTKYIMLNSSINFYCKWTCPQTNMPSYLNVRSLSLLLLNFFEEIFQDYSAVKQIATSSDYSKVFH